MIERRMLLKAFTACGALCCGPPVFAQTDTSPARPQTPSPPFPYRAEDVTIASSADGVRLAGTLTRPTERRLSPAILLLTVAGPNDRNLSFAGHEAFAVIADRLTREGFAVLRLDDRGIGQSQGDWRQASYDVLAADARSALRTLCYDPDVDPSRVGVFGLSEGSMIAAMAAAANDPPVAFAVLASPAGVNGTALLRSQLVRTLALGGITEAATASYLQAFDTFVALTRAAAQDGSKLADLQAFLEGPGRALVPPYQFVPQDAAARARLFAGPWYQSQLNLDPAPIYAAMRQPSLVINGDKDMVLPPAENLPAIRRAIPFAEFALIPNMSHMLQPSLTGAPAEYARNDITVDPRVLETMTSWLRRWVSG